ncbi:hypothetical protein [Nitrosopumilus ureiphilus]|nr:hypothetical protein [Nitrosopumilus ureiphilus]
MYFWFDWIKPEFKLIESNPIDRKKEIEKIKNLRKIMMVTAIPLWIFSAALLIPVLMDYYRLDEPTSVDFQNNYFVIGMISGCLGIVVMMIGITRLFTIQQTLYMDYSVQKQPQLS